MKYNAFDFAQEVDRQIEQLSAADDLMHKGRGKVLLEELLPISRLGVFLKLPGLSVEVESFENNGMADGHISISGFRSEEFDVQVTYIYGHEESLRRELLLSQGFAPGFGQIFRDKKAKKIVSAVKGTDSEERVDHLSNAIIERFRNKDQKAYSAKTVLLIAFDDVLFGGNKAWNLLLDAIEVKGGIGGNRFQKVFLHNCAHNELRRVS